MYQAPGIADRGIHSVGEGSSGFGALVLAFTDQENWCTRGGGHGVQLPGQTRLAKEAGSPCPGLISVRVKPKDSRSRHAV